MKNINIYKFQVKSDTRKNVIYDIVFDEDNKNFICNCPSYQYCEAEIKSCKHTIEKKIELQNWQAFYNICNKK